MPVNRRELINAGLVSLAAVMAAPALQAAGNRPRGTANGVFIDGLGFPGGMSTEEGAPLSAAELGHIRDSGLAATHLTVGAVGAMTALEAFEKIVRDIARWEQEIGRHPAVLSAVRSYADIPAAQAGGTTGLVYGLQDGVSFADDLGRLATLHHLGIRIIQPTYNRRNLLGDGCMEPANAGLSRTGKEAVERMNALNILADLSHCGRRTAADAIAVSQRPVSFTHTGCHALAEHPRHRTDSEIRKVAEGGGVTGIFIMPYLAKGRQPTANDVILHLEHAINVAGEEHVAMGTDGSISPTIVTPEFRDKFREITRTRAEAGIAAPYETETGYLFASDLNTPDRFSRLAEQLQARGHSAARIDKVLGDNLRRLFAASW